MAVVGITAVPRAVDKDGDGGFNDEMVSGNFDIVFSEVRAERRRARARATAKPPARAPII